MSIVPVKVVDRSYLSQIPIDLFDEILLLDGYPVSRLISRTSLRRRLDSLLVLRVAARNERPTLCNPIIQSDLACVDSDRICKRSQNWQDSAHGAPQDRCPTIGWPIELDVVVQLSNSLGQTILGKLTRSEPSNEHDAHN